MFLWDLKFADLNGTNVVYHYLFLLWDLNFADLNGSNVVTTYLFLWDAIFCGV